MRNWKNWEAHVENTLFLEATHDPKWKHGFVRTRRSVQLWRWPLLIPRRPHRTLEKVQGILLLKQDRNEHQCRRLLQRQRYHTTSVTGSMWSQVRLTKVVSKCQRRWSDCFDTILEHVEKKTEQSNSGSWHRCFVQNLRLLSIGQLGHGWITCIKEEDLKRDSSTLRIHSMLIPSYTLEQFKATLEENALILLCKTTCFCRTILPSTSTTLEGSHDVHSIVQSGLILGGKDVNKGCLRCSLPPWIQCSLIIIEKNGLRRDTAQNCLVQKHLESTSK